MGFLFTAILATISVVLISNEVEEARNELERKKIEVTLEAKRLNEELKNHLEVAHSIYQRYLLANQYILFQKLTHGLDKHLNDIQQSVDTVDEVLIIAKEERMTINTLSNFEKLKVDLLKEQMNTQEQKEMLQAKFAKLCLEYIVSDLRLQGI